MLNNTLLANWTAPNSVSALTTTRTHGHSQPPYDRNNLATHVGDQEERVLLNRASLMEQLHLPGKPIWLDQTHSNRCVIIESDTNRQADAAVTRQAGTVLAIMTGDCLPILLTNQAGTEVAAIHGGWRGLVNGVIENTLDKLHSSPAELLAWVGPGICPRCYEVGAEVRESCLQQYPFATQAFLPRENKWMANLPTLAELILNQSGVKNVFQSQACTFEQSNLFFSYRRQSQTGRIATLIWFN